MITLEEAKRRQLTTKDQAQRLLDKFKLIALFNQYGHYELRGSFANNLMVKPDIDGTIYVTKDDLDAVLRLAAQIIKTPGIQSVAIDNRSLLSDKHETNHAGWAIRIKIPFSNTDWNLDVLIMRREDSHGHNYLDETTYTDKQHDTMLLIKAQLAEHRLYPYSTKIPGSFAAIDIYRAVLEDGVKTTDELISIAKK